MSPSLADEIKEIIHNHREAKSQRADIARKFNDDWKAYRDTRVWPLLNDVVAAIRANGYKASVENKNGSDVTLWMSTRGDSSHSHYLTFRGNGETSKIVRSREDAPDELFGLEDLTEDRIGTEVKDFLKAVLASA